MLTRRARRRLYVVGIAALIGTSAPLWAPPVLSAVPAFGVSEVRVVGTKYLPPDEVVALADLAPEASVWDDPGAWEERVRAHPLVREARVRRTGMEGITIQVTEVEPVALVATPRLLPVDAEGVVLPLDPLESRIDLPIVTGLTLVTDGRVTEPGTRALLRTVRALRALDPAFARQISQVAAARGGGVEMYLADTGFTERILVPDEAPARGLRRVEAALRRHGTAGTVESADARFRGQVVLQIGEDG